MKNWARPTFTQALQRLDLLIHREILRLRAGYQLSLDEFRGLYISDRQVDELILRHPTLGQVDVSELSVLAARLLPQVRLDLSEDERWRRLCGHYSLSELEQDIILLAFAPELHSKYPILFGYLNNDITRKFPTVELALNLFSKESEQPRREAFSPCNTLRAQGLIVSVSHAAEHYSLQSGFVVSPTVCEFLLGHAALDQGVADVCRLSRPVFSPWECWPFAEQLLEQFQGITDLLRRAQRPGFYVLESPAGSAVDMLAENALAGAGFAVCRVDLKPLLNDRDTAAESLRSLCQTGTLEHAGLLVNDFAQWLEASADKTLLGLFLRKVSEAGLPCFLPVPPKSAWREWLSSYRYLACRVAQDGVAQRQHYWLHHLRDAGLSADAKDLAAVADYFQLSYRQIGAATEELTYGNAEGLEQGAVDRTRLFHVARQQSHGDMGELAEKVNKSHQLSDLVLPKAVLGRIKEIISAIQSRRLVFEQWGLRRRMGGASGIVALFAGASGTGKTMTASVIANEIGLDLYRIELSGIVSKYVGETEKNLDKIFTAAQRANCILFFDEADALFGKRSEVKDAHDRYANIEVAYLLQKIENHDGIVILTTNLAKSIDQAFTRRMQFIIEFPRPDIALREQLWRGMFADGLPLADDVDFNFLARQLENTGGDIKNMVLDAALMAAAGENQLIDMALLVRAAARQMMKQGKVPSAIEFKHYFSLVDSNAG